MEKYELLPQQLLHQGIVSDDYFFEPTPDPLYDYSIHDSSYLNRLFKVSLSKSEERASGFKQSRALVDREIQITNGTIEGALSALTHGIAFNIAGGTHHAFSNRPEGFCLLNDQAIASMHLLHKGLAQKILIVDLDVHQGNGTAEILKNEARVFTFSVHGANNYPMHKPQSDLDLPLADHTNDETYLRLLGETLPRLYKEFKPDFTFYQAGVDVLASDKLGRLALTLQGCRKRDEMVFECAKKFNNPVMVTMGGGYSPDIKTILDAHCQTFELGGKILER